MTQIEALLSVDAGRTPPGTDAFFLDDGTRGFRLAHAALAGAAGLAAAGSYFAGWGRAPVVLLLLLGAFHALRAIPTLTEDENRDPKRPLLVITAAGIIVRDESGLRSWEFDEIYDVEAGSSDTRPYLRVVDREGKCHTVDCAGYRRGHQVRRVLSARLNADRDAPYRTGHPSASAS